MRRRMGFFFITIVVIFFYWVTPGFSQEAQEMSKTKQEIQEPTEAQASQEAGAPKESEELYTIKDGDTLWDISAKFLKDPFLWPKLWEKNSYITNPDLIFPGNQIHLSVPEGTKETAGKPKEAAVEPRVKEEAKVETPKVEKVEETEEAPPVETKEESVAEMQPAPEAAKPPVFQEGRSAGFMSDIDYVGIGVVLESKEGKNYMSAGDILYLTLKTSESVSVGDKFTVFRADRTVRHPVTDKIIGRKFNIIGNIQIIDQYGKFYTAKVLEAFDAMKAGDRIQPYFKDKMEIEEKK